MPFKNLKTNWRSELKKEKEGKEDVLGRNHLIYF